jgi:hypothetical protein
MGLAQSNSFNGTIANEIVDKDFGIRFTLPQGWMAQKNDTGYLLSSPTEKGIIFLTGNEYGSLEQMRTEAKQGLVDENGTNLQLAGEIVAIGSAGTPPGLNAFGRPYLPDGKLCNFHLKLSHFSAMSWLSPARSASRFTI